MQATMESPDDRIKTAKAKMLDKQAAERAALNEARDLHLLSEQLRAEAKQDELAKLLESLPKPEQRQIRLQAAALLFRDAGSIMGAQKQLQLDEMTLELARYSITGQV